MKNSKSWNFNFQYSRLSTFKLQIVCLESFVADYPKDGDVLYFFLKDRSININSIGYFHTKPGAQSGSSGRNTTESDWFFRILNNFQWKTLRNHCMRQCKTWKREHRWMDVRWLIFVRQKKTRHITADCWKRAHACGQDLANKLLIKARANRLHAQAALFQAVLIKIPLFSLYRRTQPAQSSFLQRFTRYIVIDTLAVCHP